MEWYRFQPMRLIRAREAIVRAHPGTATAPPMLHSDARSRLRQRVAAAQGDTAALESLSRELTPREVRSLVGGLEHWEDLRDAVAHLLLIRIRPAHVRFLWHAWQRHPRVFEVGDILVKSADRFGWEEAVGSMYAAMARKWVTASEPGIAIQRWLDDLGLSFSDCASLAQTPFTPDTPLLRLVRNAVMAHGSGAQLGVERPERLYSWIQELGPEDRILFGRNYLVKIRSGDWHRPILEWIERSYGVPRRPSFPPFWEGVPESVKSAFQKLFIRKWIREIFHNDIDRRDYWERWADHIEYVQRGEVARTEYGVLDFGSFGVVEFFEYGHAAYFYPEQMLARIRARTITTASDLRELYNPPFGFRSSNRLIHSPAPRGWFGRADEMVATWIEGTSVGRIQ